MSLKTKHYNNRKNNNNNNNNNNNKHCFTCKIKSVVITLHHKFH